MSTTSQTQGPQVPPLLEETIGQTLRRIAQRFGEREALVSRHQDRRLTYAQLDAEVDRLARGLLAAGLAQGDRVGIWSPNGAEWALAQLATARAGVILVTINPAYRTTELVYALNQSGCRLLIAARSFKSSDYAAMVDEVRDELATVEHVVWIGDTSWDALVAGGDEVADEALAAREAALAPTDAINIQYTSGTTGAPKGATLSHRNILNNGYLVGV
ncbi:MAG TPA: AMP-binding protein, partial [Baekduia sp.]